MGTLAPYDLLRFGRNDRLPERFVTSEVHTLDHKGKTCLLAITLEISNPWHHAREYGQQIISTVVREFARSQSASSLIKFEQALKLANHTIAQAKEKLNVQINAAVAFLSDDEVHFTVLGSSKLLLYRKNRLIDVTTEETADTEKFSSVTSGDLSAGEWLVLCNPDMAAFLLKENPVIWNETDVEALATELVETAPVERREGFSAVMLRYQPDAAPQDQTVLWDNLEHVTPIKLPKLSLPAVNLGSFIETVTTFLRTVPQHFKTLKEKLPRRPATAAVAADDDIFGTKPRFRIRPQLIGVLLLVVLLGFGIRGVIGKFRAPKTETKTPTLVEELVAIPVGQRSTYLAGNFNYGQYDSLSAEQKSTFGQALAAENIALLTSAAAIAELPNEIVAIDSFNDQLAVLDATGQLWRIQSNRAIKIDQPTPIQQPFSVVALNEQRMLASDRAGNLWLVDGTSAPVALALPSSITSGPKLIQKFDGNLYLYHVESKTVYRQGDYDRELSSLRIAVRPELLPEPLVDLAINGDFVTLSQTGKITGVRAGKVTHQALEVAPGTVMQLTTSEVNDKLFAYSAPFLRVADNRGGLQQTLFALHPQPLKDLVLDGYGKNLWLAFGKQVHRITL